MKLVALLLIAVASAGGSQFSGIDRYVRAEMERNQIPGVSLAIVRAGEIAHAAAYGVRSLATGQPMTLETLVDLASVSKPMTALAVLQLYEAGRLDLDAPVRRYLPEFDVSDEAAAGKITVRQLLRHTSGLRRKQDHLAPCCGMERQLDLQWAVQQLHRAQLNRPVGARFEYANSNYVLLAALVARVTGEPFPAYMRERVFAPLGMKHTTLDADEARHWGLAEYHEPQWGRVRVSPSKFSGWYGASLVKSNAADMTRFLIAMLNSGANDTGRVVSPSSLNLAHGEAPYDLGWFIEPRAGFLGGGRVVSHTGEIWGSNAAVMLAPDLHLGVVVLANAGVNRAGAIARGVLARAAGLPGPAPAGRSWRDNPDSWAILFAVAAALIAGWLLVQVWRAAKQFRRGERHFVRELHRPLVVRSLILLAMATYLVYLISSRAAPRLATLPTTLKTGSVVLALTTAALLLVTAILGLAPITRRNA